LYFYRQFKSVDAKIFNLSAGADLDLLCLFLAYMQKGEITCRCWAAACWLDTGQPHDSFVRIGWGSLCKPLKHRQGFKSRLFRGKLAYRRTKWIAKRQF